jgi:hypothetical protein
VQRSVATLFVCVCAALYPLAGAASAQVYTWTGGSASSQNWSDPANWSPTGTPPSGATLMFPMLSAACSGMTPTQACYVSDDDLGIAVNAITVHAEPDYSIGGGPIPLGAGGLTVDPSNGPPAGFQTIALAVDQTWNLGGPLSIDQVTGDHALTVDLDPQSLHGIGSVFLEGDAEVGPVGITGGGTFELDGSTQIGESALNAHDGQPVTLRDGAELRVGSLAAPQIGSLTSSVATVAIGFGSPATLAVDGDAALSQTQLQLQLDSPGPGSELTATGNVRLGGTLSLMQGHVHGNTCGAKLTPGTVYPLVTAGGTVTGRFVGIPNKAVVGIERTACAPETEAVRIVYTPQSVTATIVPGPSQRQISAALSHVVKPHGRNAAIKRLLKNGGYTFAFAAPGTGTIDLSWNGRSHHHSVVVGSGTAEFGTTARGKFKLKLTKAGRALLKHGAPVKLTAHASYAALSGPYTKAHASFTLAK